MYYIVQENTFNEEGHTKLLESLERFGLDYEIVKVLPFTDEVDYKTDRTDVFVFGGMKLARISKSQAWKPGSLMNDYHNFLYQRNIYHKHMLNFDSDIYRFKEEFPWSDACPAYFIRPCEDTKAFNGKVFDRDEWSKFRHDAITYPENFSSQLTGNTFIQVAKVKRTMKEFRFWIVGGRIVTGSQYKQNSRYYINGTVDQDAIDFCNNMLRGSTGKRTIAKAFVMDVGLTTDGYKIVECGCINCAGFYNADMQKLVATLEECWR
jgi:hypothetical protein